MLEELHISKFALIDNLKLDFGQGFTVFTGETGAGKSILAGALGLLSGAKGTVDQIRTGEEEASVSGVFSVPASSEIQEWLGSRGIDASEGRIILRRVLRRSGKNSNYVQSIPVSLKDLAELSEYLFDLHGQHEHQSLFDPAFHLRYLDAYAGLGAAVAGLRDSFLELAGLKRRLEYLQKSAAERERERNLLEFAIEEIEAAKLRPGEEEELESEKNRLESAEELKVLAEQAYELFHGEEFSVLRGFNKIRSQIQSIAQLDSSQDSLSERVAASYFELEDMSLELAQFKDRVIYDPEKLDSINERLDLLYRLKKKYGASVAEVLKHAETAQQQLDGLIANDDDSNRLIAEIRNKEQAVLASAAEISNKRKEVAKKMETAVRSALEDLKMGKIQFVVQVLPRKSESGGLICGPTGADDVEFLLSSNPGEPAKALRSIASGGEISRVMLSIKSVLSEVDGVETLIFDEIDTGIGGEVGVALGEYMARTSARRQLISITHLASIAIRADNHVRIVKTERNGRTFTEAGQVRGRDRIEEVARMLSGSATAEASLVHAEELLRKYHKVV